MSSNGIYDHAATYSIVRPGAESHGLEGAAPFPVQVILEAADRSTDQGSRLIALVYLLIGLYVLLRRWTAPKSTHFYVFCLVSFVLYAFRSTGDPGLFDRVIYWGNLAANMLQPALFLHFAVSFSDPTEDGGSTEAKMPRRLRRQVLAALLYVPGAFLIGLQAWAINFWSATGVLSHRLDQISIGYMALYYAVAAVVFYSRYLRAGSPLERQQLKWLTRGTLLAVGPFTVLYAIPYLLGLAVPTLLAKFVLLCLALLPLTFSWAIVRYRLMDVDLIFKRGVTYTLATAALAGLYFGVVALCGEMVHTRYPGFGFVGPDRGDHGDGAVVRSAEADDPGAGGPRVRPEELRLSRDADRLWPQPELADRPARAGGFDCGAASAPSRGFPNVSPSITTTVSAPNTKVPAGAEAATCSALSRATRRANCSAVSSCSISSAISLG